MSEEPLKLYFVADDYGVSAETNEAIARVCAGGIVRSVSVLAGEQCVFSPENVRGLAGEVAFGAHLYLTDLPPLTSKLKEVAGLAGRFSKVEVLRALLLRRVSYPDVETEFAAQMDCLRAHGFELKFVDTHQNIHGMPLLLEVVRRFTRKQGLDRALRPSWQLDFSLRLGLRALLSGMQALRVGFRPRARVVVECPGYGVNEVPLDEALKQWDRFLAEVKERDYDALYVPCHPGCSSAEIKIYSSSAFLELLRQHNVSLMNGGEELK